MDREKGISYFGLASRLCEEDTSCTGCRAGKCKESASCKSFHCCTERNLRGCWQCECFPCNNKMFDSTRIRAFVEFIRRYGEGKLLDCLERNEKEGVLYHYPGKLVGDYDQFSTMEQIISMLLGVR